MESEKVSRPLRILWASQIYFDIQSSRTSRLEMVRALASLGHDVKLIVTLADWRHKRDCEVDEHVTFVRVIRLPVFCTITFQAWFFLFLVCSLFNGLDIVIVDDRTIWGAIPFSLLSRISGLRTKFVLDIRSVPVDLEGALGILRDWIFHLALILGRHFLDGLTVITPTLAREVCVKCGFDEKQIGIWSSGVSLSKFDPCIKARADDLPNLDGKFVLIYHGSLSPNRGLQQTVRAISLAKHKWNIPVAMLLIGDGGAVPKLRILIEQEQLQHDVYMYPPVSYEMIPAYIAAADAGIVPLPDIAWWRVSSPLKLMEYLAMGKPVVVTDIEAHRSVLGDTDCAFYMSTNAPEEIARAIGKVYDKRDQLKELGMAGRRIVEGNYTWEIQAKRLEAYLELILDRSTQHDSNGNNREDA